MIKAIIFDCFGVLTVDKWKEFTASLPDGQRQEISSLNRSYDQSEINVDEFLQRVEKLTGKKPSEIDDIRNIAGTKNEELLAYISSLKPDYKIGLLSNVATNWIREKLLTAEEQSIFDQMIFSFEVKLTKPDPLIYQLAAKRLDVAIEECVLIDDINHYCTAAEHTGMKAILYQNFEQMKDELEKILAKG